MKSLVAWVRSPWGLSLALAGGALLACSKPADTGAPPAPAPSAMTVPSVSAAPSDSAAPSAQASAAAEVGLADAKTDAALAGATGAKGAGSAAPSAAAGDPQCGKKPLPDCPLQAWMKANTAAATAASDLPAIATALDKVVSFAPPGYTNWASIAKDGAKAARAGDEAAAKASCRGCHDQYKAKYKTEMRARPIAG